ncbi:MAG: HlyD family efflux transporter periplasmic adaptor subunit [Acidobacteriaceae bacterium]|nr:HlyD family efflux transporter periplasmic adaptor subunit [Acidobacteriaceae bacterium]
MANSFYRSRQSLRRDNGLKSIAGLGVALLLGAAWIYWAWNARIARYETSDSARLEIDGAAYPVQANVAGRLTRSALTLGAEVQSGEVLAELDSHDARLTLQQERVHLTTLHPQIEALHSQIESEHEGSSEERHVLSLSQEAARAQYREADAQAALAEQEADRARRLRAEGISADADTQRAIAQAQSKRAAADNLKVALTRLAPEELVRERDRDVRQKQILTEIAKLEAERAASAAAIERLEYEIERRRIRAPISGRLGECAALHPGAHISEGQQLGLILARGRMQMVAQFDPSAALGKIRPGQPAIVRLQGFPWAQFGNLSAEVSQVADDIRDGKVRVELNVNPGANPRIHLQHGLPGSVEVEVGSLSPLALVVRSAGRFVGAH